MIGGFRTIQDFLGYKWINKLHSLSSKHNLGLFDCIARISKSDFTESLSFPLTKSYFTQEFLEAEVSKDTDKILLCGTPEMHKSIFDNLLALGFKEEIIHFV